MVSSARNNMPRPGATPRRRRRPAFLSPCPVLPHAARTAPHLRPHQYPCPRARLPRVYPRAALSPTDPPPQYVPLHVHSDFSLLDGASQLPSLVARAAELKVPALALTDHGVLYGAVQLVRLCARHGVKPIIGNEMYLVNEDFSTSDEARQSKEYKPPKRYHLIVLAKNTTGYRNLVKLTTMAHMSGKVGKGIFARPSINKAQLFQHREGLIVSSACLGGEIPQAILNDKLDVARDVAKWYRDVLGDDFYLEIQDHGSAEDKKVNPHIIRLSHELGIKAIATNDSHFTNCLDAEAHDALICIQTGKMLSDENRLHYAGNEYFKSIDEMRECFVDHLPREAVDEALQNTLGVADKISEYDLFGSTRIPDFPIPQGFEGSHDAYLAHVAQEGLATRLAARQRTGLADPTAEQQYYERLELELEMLAKMGFSSYFLVVWDYVKHAKDHNIPVGPGRGSAAGSLVAFALRITDVDPIPFNLLFERFLNPERKSMPDIDTDFSVKGREKIISYVSQRYGPDRVAQIITFNRLTSKAVLKDVARVHDVPYSEADRLAKLIPVVRGKPATLTKLLSDDTPSPDFKRMIQRNNLHQAWIDKAMRIEGTNKTYGIHAAGVVISASPLTDIVPLSRAKHGETITQYAMEDVESLGLLKMDFLGLKNLTVIETALEFINEGRRALGIEEDLDFSVDALPLDDKNTYRLLAEGELDGIFQLDASAGMRNIVRELRPSSLEDISSILALYRPGPLDAGLIPKFIKRKHGKEQIEYDHPLLEPILRETYGIMVYQEQIMRIARDLAGYSLGQADILRRAMGKKKTADMEREKPRFVDGAKERGVSEDKAVELFDMMIKFAEYCFNKSHSTAYAYLTYQTAYLKANYPVEYSAALLRSNMNQSDKLVRYLADANVSGVQVAPPSVNKSDLGFTVDRTDEKEAVVLFGLEAVKTVGGSVGTALLEERTTRGPFKNIIDLIERVNLRVLNKRAMGALIQAGAFDELHPNRRVLLDRLDGLLALRRKLRDRKKRRQSKDLSPEEEQAAGDSDALEWEIAESQLDIDSSSQPDFPLLTRLAGEKATLGFYASGHPLYDLQTLAKTLDCTRVGHVIGDAPDSEYDHDSPSLSNGLAEGSDVMMLSCITDLKQIITAKGKKMARWMVEDATARVPGILFPNVYDVAEQVVDIEKTKNFSDDSENAGDAEKNVTYVVEEDARVLVWGKVDRESSGTTQIIVDDVQRVQDVKIVMATAHYNTMRTPDDHLDNLRHVAARVLDVDLSSSQSTKYLDPNGIVRKRRSKAVPLSKKNRVPLILRCLDENGQVYSYRNAGNVVRFPSDCADLLVRMREVLGFDMDLLSVSEDLIRTGIDPDSASAEEASIECLGQHSKSSVQIAEGLVQNSDSNGLEDSAPEPIQIPSLPVIGESRTEAFEPDTSLVQDENAREEDSAQCEEEEKVYDVHGVRLTEEEYSEHQAMRREKVTDFSYMRRSRLDESLLSTLRSTRRAQMVVRATAASLGEQESQVKGHTSSNAVVMTDRTRPSARTAEAPAYRSSSSVVANVQRDFPSSSQAVASDTTPLESERANFNFQYRFYKDEERFTGGSDFDRIQIDTDENRSMEEESNVVDTDSRSNDLNNVSRVHDGFEHERKRKEETGVDQMADQQLQATGRKAVTSLDGEEDGDTDVSEAKTTSRSLCNLRLPAEAEVSCGRGNLAEVLDAIALVGGAAVSSKCQARFSVNGISGLDIAKLAAEVAELTVTERMTVSTETQALVLLNVKEAKASGGRRRARSFGPVAMLFVLDQPCRQIPVKTKKAKKDLETAKTKMETACKEMAVTVQRESGLGSSKDDSTLLDETSALLSSAASFEVTETDLDGCTLYDGGYLLSVLTRAAKTCIDKCLSAKDSVVTSLDGFVVNIPTVLASGLSVKVRMHVEGTFLGTAKVQAEAYVVGREGESTACLASFRVSNPRLKGWTARAILEDEDPLFREADIKSQFQEIRHIVTSFSLFTM